MRSIGRLLSRIRRRVLRPAVLRRVSVAGTGRPRTRKVPDDGLPRVYRISCPEGLEQALHGLDRAWSRFPPTLLQPSHRVLIKINLNTGDPYPASTDPAMLVALIRFLHSKGIRDIWVGDCSSNGALPTQRVARRNGVLAAVGNSARMLYFDKGLWLSVAVDGRYLDHVTIPKDVLEFDRIVALANLKNHRLAGFSFGIKLAVGYLHPLERVLLHLEHLQEKIAELALAVQPDLTIIDGRTAFVTGGPEIGRTESGDVVLVGMNPLAVDVQAYKELYALKRKHGCTAGYTDDPFTSAQLRRAREIGVGGLPWRGYECEDL